ncbi:MAG: NFACT family protein [Chloroflexia bacterium]
MRSKIYCLSSTPGPVLYCSDYPSSNRPMPFDALTIAAVRQELEDKIAGARVQNVIMPGPLTVSFEVYRGGTGRTHLIASSHPQNARVHLTHSAPSRDPEQHPPLLLLLRKYVRGGAITDISQPHFERVLVLSIAKRFWPDKHQEYHLEEDLRHTPDAPDDKPEAPINTVEIYIEVMGRLSNIVLVASDGTVIDSIKRVPPSINRYRTTLPHHHYVAPPPQDKRDPTRVTPNALSLELAKIMENDNAAPVWKGLVSGFSGVSPALAREVTFTALGDTLAKAEAVARRPDLLSELLVKLQAMFNREQARTWEPVVAWKEVDGERHPSDFAAYPLTHLKHESIALQKYPHISEAAEEYYQALQSMGGHGALKGQVRAELEEARKQAERKLRSLREELQQAEALEELRRKGEFLLAYAHTVEPGQTSLVVPDEALTIELDPGLSPSENAQAIFKEYRKAKSARAGLPEKIDAAQMQADYFDELLTSLDLANGYDEIRAVQADFRSSGTPAPPPPNSSKGKTGKKKATSKQPKVPQPLRLRTRYGAHMLVGRTASQNDIATFRIASPDDLWLHARGVPGAHVILRTEGGVSNADIEEAASIAAAYSKARNESQVDVLCTEKRYVRKVPNSPPGFVTFKNERVIRVAPRAAKL